MEKKKEAIRLQNKLFRKASIDRISSPEKLNDYIQVSNPGSWMVLGAALCLLLGLLCWGFFGSMSDSVSFTGQVRDGVVCCYVDGESGAALKSGMEATVLPLNAGEDTASIAGSLLFVAEQPISYEEACAQVGSAYMISMMGISGWNVAVTVQTQEPLYEGVLYDVSVVTDTYRPIELVFQ